jgi:hypothetical protein
VPFVGPVRATLRRRRFMGRSGTRWMMTLVVLLIGLVVIPHLAIHGRHYHFWLIP